MRVGQQTAVSVGLYPINIITNRFGGHNEFLAAQLAPGVPLQLNRYPGRRGDLTWSAARATVDPGSRAERCNPRSLRGAQQ